MTVPVCCVVWLGQVGQELSLGLTGHFIPLILVLNSQRSCLAKAGAEHAEGQVSARLSGTARSSDHRDTDKHQSAELVSSLAREVCGSQRYHGQRSARGRRPGGGKGKARSR